MSTVGQIERKTQARLVALLRDPSPRTVFKVKSRFINLP